MTHPTETPRCFYCDRIARHTPAYPAREAAFDLASEAPRCARHWRVRCGLCNRSDHFMAVAHCPLAGKLFCRRCAAGTMEVPAEFWGYSYHLAHRSPWSGQWCPALDRLEFEDRYPLAAPEALATVLAPEADLRRCPPRPTQWRAYRNVSEDDSRVTWNTNAARWDATYDADGDRNRRYQSDEPMLEMLGDVGGRTVLDAGSGNGYLCRKLARLGATVTGVELSDEFLRLARGREAEEPLGITYVHGSVARMGFLAPESLDRAVSNYVLMDVQDYEAAVGDGPWASTART